VTPSTTPGALITGEFTDRRAQVTVLGHVGYAIDRIGDLSATPSTSPIGVAGVGDRTGFGSMA